MATLNSSTPRTWTSSETVTAAMLNEELSSNFNAVVVLAQSTYLSDTTSTAISCVLPAAGAAHKHVRIVGTIKTESTVSANIRGQWSGITSSAYSYGRITATGATSTGEQQNAATSGVFGVNDRGVVSGVSYAPFDITIPNANSTNWKAWISEHSRFESTATGGLFTWILGGVCASTIATSTALILFAGSPGAGLNLSSGTRLSVYWIP